METKKAFTLIELVTAIAIIAIVGISFTRINFARLSSEQKLDIFTNEIITHIETARDFSLTGKGIGGWIVTPDEWIMEITTSWSGRILTTYSWSINGIYNDLSWATQNGYELKSIRCEKLDSTNEALTSTGTITIRGWDMSLTGCSDNFFRKLLITTTYRWADNLIEVNTLNNVIEQK